MTVIIEELTLFHLSMPMVTAFETSFGRNLERECVLVAASAQGEVGYGEVVADNFPGYNYETIGTAWHVLTEFLGPAVLGRPLSQVEELSTAMAPVRGHLMAKAGLELAWWDLRGKLNGQSLQQMLGGVGRAVEVGVSVGIQDTPAGLVQAVERYLELGYGRIKIKIKPGRDLEDTRAVRQAFPGVRLQVDANSAYTQESAEGLLPLDDLDLLLIEQPLAEDDLWDHRGLQERLETPLCLDESILSARHARQALEMGACRVINIKPGRVGGLREAVRIHEFCRGRQVPVWCGGMLETGVGRAANLALASLPGFTLPGDISATERYYDRDITAERFILQPDSTITVPTGPGLGVMIDQHALASVTRAQTTMRSA